jgi:hypothetical protein
MEITINELLEGKSTLIKNKQFLSTKAYIEPFVERMSAFTNDFKIQVKTPDQITTNGNGNRDIAFNRVLIQALLPKSYYEEDNHQKVVGMVYGLDVKMPVAKIYMGGLNMACTNLTVFNPEFLNVQEIEPETALNYSSIKQLMEKTDDLAVMLKKLKSTHININNQEDMEKNLGKWIDFTLRESYNTNYGKVKIASSVPIDVYKDLFIDTDSDYYTPNGIDPSLFTVYNAFTNVISNDNGKDLLTKYEKCTMVSKMLGITK